MKELAATVEPLQGAGLRRSARETGGGGGGRVGEGGRGAEAGEGGGRGGGGTNLHEAST